MRKVLEIQGMEHRKVIKTGKRYTITHLLLDDGTEATFYGTNIDIGDNVMVAYHRGNIKAIKPLDK